MAGEKNVSRRNMQLILNEDMGFSPYHKRSVQSCYCRTNNKSVTKIQEIAKTEM